MGQETLPVTWPVENTSTAARLGLFLIFEHSREPKSDKYGLRDEDFPPLSLKKLSNLLLPNQRGLGALIALVGPHYFYQHCLTIESIFIFVWKFASIPTLAHCSSPHLASSPLLFLLPPAYSLVRVMDTPLLFFVSINSYHTGILVLDWDFPGFSFPRLTAEVRQGRKISQLVTLEQRTAGRYLRLR